ncbi:hypothetical protein AKJ09_06370 [Labilithrix luteola]|uniref:Uncharacterized protein n=1 Tax=Labilithrix luteola TaxID=1391654 RepID=A0A0K1Q247_9BACT|nr:hypothetical protein [Labilithrix luteola]AKU99706.1 hypothetical protein AKJ09_06370 [Labilithrix luteola]
MSGGPIVLSDNPDQLPNSTTRTDVEPTGIELDSRKALAEPATEHELAE